jgi:hypothetical protein
MVHAARSQANVHRVVEEIDMVVIRGSAYAVDARTPVISFRH